MKGYSDSLRGYGHETHVKYNFICQFCGYDGRAFPNWLQLTVDHILPTALGGEDDLENYITACHACNSITSRMKDLKGKSKREIINLKREEVKESQTEYFEFWQEHVSKRYIQKMLEENIKQQF